jgi:UDP-N-acetylmuramate--alanine ligase
VTPSHSLVGWRVHLIGIGGIGMAALAQYLHQRGAIVSGCDRESNDVTAQLQSLGILVQQGHSPNHLPGVEAVIVTAAAASLEEIEAARAAAIPVVKRAELLGRLTSTESAGQQTVAVSGTHGKSTTTALTAHLLRSVGVDATLFGGALIRSNGHTIGPALIGSAPVFVVEADEYDRSFLQLRPSTTVVTSLDFDHPDIYESLDKVAEAYAQLLRQTRDRVIVNSGARLAGEVAQAVASENGLTPTTYGFDADDDWNASLVAGTRLSTSFGLTVGGKNFGSFSTRLIGRHNVLNALAALAAAATVSSTTPEDLREPLATFGGLARRLDIRGEVGSVLLVDDYAHHPAEIIAVVDTLRASADGSLRVVFQPHTYSRTASLLDEFADALSGVDDLVLVPTYAAREIPDDGIDTWGLVDVLRKRGIDVSFAPSLAEAARTVAGRAEAGDIVVTMGAGPVNDALPLVREALENRFGE